MTSERAALGLSSRDKSRMEEVQRLAASGAQGVAGLVTLLAEPSWVVRRAVVASLARIGTPAIADLCNALTIDRTNETRLAAAVDALVASGGDVEPAVLELAERATTPAIVCDVAQILGRRKSRDAMPTLARWSEHSDDNVAVAALEAIGRIGGTGAVDPLLTAVRSGNFFRTFPAISVLGQSGDPRAITPLVELLREPHYAAEAALALGRSGQLSAVGPLAGLLADADNDGVRAVALALADLRNRHVERFGDPMAVAAAFRDVTVGESITDRLKGALAEADLSSTLALATVLGWVHDETGVAALIALLDSEPAISQLASNALRSLGQEAEPAILLALRNGDSARRARLIPLLGARKLVVGDLLLCLQDGDPLVRAQACGALGRIGDTSAAPLLFTLIGDRDERVVHASIAAIQSLGSDDVKTHALTASRSPDARKRRAALRILSYFGFPEGLDVLLDGIVSEDERIREAAAAGLALLDDARAMAALVTASHHPSSATRAATMRSLGHAARTSSVVSVLLSGLDDENAWVRYYACQSLGKLRVSNAEARVEAMLSDDAGQVRVAAVEAIAALGGDRALAALDHLSQSADVDVRRAALTGLGRIRRPDALGLLLVAAESTDPVTRLAAVTAIAETNSAEAVRALIRAGSDADDVVRTNAFDLLGARPGPLATRWLIDRIYADEDRERALAGLTQAVEGRIEGILLALETADAPLSAYLIEALLRMRRPNGNAAAEAALHLDNVHARRAAAAALANVGTGTSREALSAAAVLDPDSEVRRLSAATR